MVWLINCGYSGPIEYAGGFVQGESGPDDDHVVILRQLDHLVGYHLAADHQHQLDVRHLARAYRLEIA